MKGMESYSQLLIIMVSMEILELDQVLKSSRLKFLNQIPKEIRNILMREILNSMRKLLRKLRKMESNVRFC